MEPVDVIPRDQTGKAMVTTSFISLYPIKNKKALSIKTEGFLYSVKGLLLSDSVLLKAPRNLRTYRR
jgi:hypothetical protein